MGYNAKVGMSDDRIAAKVDRLLAQYRPTKGGVHRNVPLVYVSSDGRRTYARVGKRWWTCLNVGLRFNGVIVGKYNMAVMEVLYPLSALGLLTSAEYAAAREWFYRVMEQDREEGKVREARSVLEQRGYTVRKAGKR
jgi:hypothetical protein